MLVEHKQHSYYAKFTELFTIPKPTKLAALVINAYVVAVYIVDVEILLMKMDMHHVSLMKSAYYTTATYIVA